MVLLGIGSGRDAVSVATYPAEPHDAEGYHVVAVSDDGNESNRMTKLRARYSHNSELWFVWMGEQLVGAGDDLNAILEMVIDAGS